MTLVVDASVVIKWLLNDHEREAQTERATQVMQQIVEGREAVIQPIHWLLEVGAVLARINPDGAEEDLAMLQAFDFVVDDDPLVLRRACRLAIDLQQHLFDTLYHAVALQTPGTTLITADDRYLRASGKLGRIVSLADWQPSEAVRAR
ncbi:MAG: type II toxin-antitoxin system VapC family toxin [Steroidobacteraceae bacterium]